MGTPSSDAKRRPALRDTHVAAPQPLSIKDESGRQSPGGCHDCPLFHRFTLPAIRPKSQLLSRPFFCSGAADTKNRRENPFVLKFSPALTIVAGLAVLAIVVIVGLYFGTLRRLIAARQAR